MLPLGRGGPHRRVKGDSLTVPALTSRLFLLTVWRAGKAGPLLAVLLLPTSPPEIPSRGIQRDGNHGTGVTTKGIPVAMSAAGEDVTLFIECAGSRRGSWPEVAEP